MIMFLASIAAGIIVLIEFVSAVLLTIFGVRALKANRYVRLRVVLAVPNEKKERIASIDDLPVV
jgi:hypothetical protein